jgi:hypothetical protein
MDSLLWGIELTETGIVLLGAAGVLACWKLAKLIWVALSGG